MRHRHLNSETTWSKAAIDSALERGDLQDWSELFSLARYDRQLAEAILEVARRHPLRGVLPIVEHLVARSWPELAEHSAECGGYGV